jgi:hypothetical protein
MKNGLRLGFCLVTIALFGGVMHDAVATATAAPRASGTAAPQDGRHPQGKQDRKAHVAKGGTGQGPRAGPKDTGPAGRRGPAAVDTPVTPESRGPLPTIGKERDTPPGLKFSPPAIHREPAPAAASPVYRNAIGLPAGRPEETPRVGFAPPSSPAGPQSPGGMLPGGATAIGRPAAGIGPGGDLKIVHPNLTPTVTAFAPSRGRIDGTALIRPGAAVAGVGGPAKVAGGINGTTVRPKH